MTATTTSRRTIEVLDPARVREFVVKTSETIFQGALVALDSSGELVDATETANEGPYFMATGNMATDNPSTGTSRFGLTNEGELTSALSGTRIEVRTGMFWWANGESIGDNDVGAAAFCDDNQTVKTTSTSTSQVGVILRVTSANGVLVDMWPSDAVVPANSIDTAQIAAGAVDTTELAADAVDGTKIEDNAVDSEHLAAGGIDTEHYAAASVTPIKLAGGSRQVTANAALALVDTDVHILLEGVTDNTTITTSSANPDQPIWIRLEAVTSNEYELAVEGGTLTFNAAEEAALICRNAGDTAWEVYALIGATIV